MDHLRLITMALLAPLTLAGCSNVPSRPSVDEVATYLEEHYEHDFEPVDDEPTDTGGNPSTTYHFQDPENPEVIFEAGVKEEEGTFPFLPPTKEPIFYDTYYETSKEQLIKRFTADMDLKATGESDIAQATRQVHETMERINEALENQGFDVTTYTPSFEAEIATPNGTRTITFYQMDESTIAGQLREIL